MNRQLIVVVLVTIIFGIVGYFLFAKFCVEIETLVVFEDGVKIYQYHKKEEGTSKYIILYWKVTRPSKTRWVSSPLGNYDTINKVLVSDKVYQVSVLKESKNIQISLKRLPHLKPSDIDISE